MAILNNYLKPIADAIRSKKGTTEPINAQNFASEIESIEPILDTINIVSNGMYDVKDYKKAEIIITDDNALLAKKVIEGTTPIDYKIPYGVTKLRDKLFEKTNINFRTTQTPFLPETVKVIGNYTFSEVTFSYADEGKETFKYITELGDYAFYKINGFKMDDFSNLVKIGNYSFSQVRLDSENCSLIFPNVETVGSNCFSSMKTTDYPTERPSISLPKLIEVPVRCFYGVKGQGTVVERKYWEFDIPLATTLGERAFAGTSIYNINMPNVKELPNNCFGGYSGGDWCNFYNKYYEMPDNIEILGKECFRGADFEDVYLSKNLKIIGELCFSGAKMKQIKIPATVTQIGNSAFLSCSYLEYVVIESQTPCTLGTSVFQSTSKLKKIYVPKGTSSVFKSATNWSAYADKIFEPNIVIFNIDSQLINNENATYNLNETEEKMFENTLFTENDVSTLKVASKSADVTILVGTTEGGSEIGTITNATLTFAFETDTTIYITLQ